MSTKALDKKTLFKVYHGAKPNLGGLPEFGCKVWVHTMEGSKLDGQAVEGRWVGYDEDSSSHRIYSPDKRTVSVQQSVKFNKDDINVYLPHTTTLEGERKKVEWVLEEISKDGFKDDSKEIDPLGENFEQLIQSRPKRV